MATSQTKLDAWIKEWNGICDEAIRRVKQGKGDAAEFVRDAVAQSGVLPQVARDALDTIVRGILSLGQGALEDGLDLARHSGVFGLRLRALFS